MKHRTEVFQTDAKQHGVEGSVYWNPFLPQVSQHHRGQEVQAQLLARCRAAPATCQDAQAGPSSLLLASPLSKAPPAACSLLLSPPLLTGIPLVMVQAQGRSPLAWHKFPCKLAGRRRSHTSFTAWAPQGELPALLGSSLTPGSSPGEIMRLPPAWELLNQKKICLPSRPKGVPGWKKRRQEAKILLKLRV